MYRENVGKSTQARHHLFVAQDTMSDALASVYRQCDGAERMLITVQASQTPEQALTTSLVAELPLATAVYACGDENFLWRVATALSAGGMLDEQIHLLPPISKVRQVFCCHCYELTSNVTHSPTTCAGCQRELAVTDHFSRALGAYLGYQVNAEDPEAIPAATELN